MDAGSEPGVEFIVGELASQLGKTEAINNSIGHAIDHDPGPMMVVQPSVEMAEAWSKDRLAPMLRDTPALHGKVKDARSRDSGNTILHKQYPGGQLSIVGANAPSGLASRPIRYVYADEVNRYPMSAGTEGDPLAIIIQRTANFWNRKIFMISTPTIKGASRITDAFEEGDKRRYWVPCHHCDQFQVLVWGNVHWPEGDPAAACYRCKECGLEITDAHKPDMLTRGQWRAEKPTGKIASFHLSALYSPFVTFATLAGEWTAAQGSPERLKAFINLKLAEVWADKIVGETLEADYIRHRAEAAEYSYSESPDGVAVLVASVDTQNDRLEVSVIGYGEGEESWRVDRFVILGDPNAPENRDPNDAERRNVWQRLDAEVLATEYGGMRIKACVVDTGGGRTQAAYNYCATPKHPCPIYAIKGSSRRDEPYVPVDKKGRSKFTIVRAKSGKRLKLFMIGVSQGKDLLFGLLKQETPGAGYMHFPVDVADDYIEQLTAEVKVERKHYGQPYHVWEIKSGRRNEAIDLEVYARALVRLLRVKLDAPPVPRSEEPPEGEEPQPTPRPAQRKPKQRKGGWVNRF